MCKLLVTRFFIFSILFSGVFVLDAFAAVSVQKITPQQSVPTAQQRSVEEVNSLIIDSYRSRLDRVLSDLYANIELASG